MLNMKFWSTSFLDESIFYGSYIPYIKYAYCIYLRDILMQTMKASYLHWLLVVKTLIVSLNRIDQASYSKFYKICKQLNSGTLHTLDNYLLQCVQLQKVTELLVDTIARCIVMQQSQTSHRVYLIYVRSNSTNNYQSMVVACNAHTMQ